MEYTLFYRCKLKIYNKLIFFLNNHINYIPESEPFNKFINLTHIAIWHFNIFISWKWNPYNYYPFWAAIHNRVLVKTNASQRTKWLKEINKIYIYIIKYINSSISRANLPWKNFLWSKKYISTSFNYLGYCRYYLDIKISPNFYLSFGLIFIYVRINLKI